jgi:hypothetical protein
MRFPVVISFHSRNLSCKMARYSPFAQAVPARLEMSGYGSKG